MKRRARFCFSLPAVSAAVCILAGCGGSQLFGSSGRPVSPAVRAWMAPGAKKQPSLLYVSNDGTASVTVYTYLDGAGLILVGTLTGFSRPKGMCTDRAGDVWVVDEGTRKLYEYAHGGATPIFTIRETGSSEPIACAVDPNTGDLAVANQFPNAHYYEQGNVKLYHPGSHTGTKYSMGFMQVEFLAFDNHDNLFVDGLPTDPYGYGNGPLVEIPSGGKALVNLTVNGGELDSPRAIQWINPTLLVGDREGNSLFAYKLFVSGSVATVVGTLPFANTLDTYGFWRRAEKVVVPDWSGDVVRIYSLSDGTLYGSVTDDISKPFAAVISQP